MSGPIPNCKPTTAPNYPSKQPPSASHLLFLLTDSALPLSTFAFSSGLESHLAHHPNAPFSLQNFATKSLYAASSLALPFVYAAYDSTTLSYTTTTTSDPVSTFHPTDLQVDSPQESLQDRLLNLNDLLDAHLLCPVQRRTSISQGRALSKIWEKVIFPSLPSSPAHHQQVKTSTLHLPLLWGYVCARCGISREESAWSFAWGLVKGIVSAAVRLNVVGPFAGQKCLLEMEGGIRWCVERARGVEVDGEDVGTGTVWWGIEVLGGRQELLYSRVFNS